MEGLKLERQHSRVDAPVMSILCANEWILIYLYSHKLVCIRTEKCNAYNEICLGNSLHVCICLTTAKITDWSQWWHIVIIFNKLFHLKIVLHHRFQRVRLTNITVANVHRGEHVGGPPNSQPTWTVDWTLAYLYLLI